LRTLVLNEKVFQLYIPSEIIESVVDDIANRMNHDLAGKKPLFIGLLNGAFMFYSDLMKRIDFECNITFVKLKSYDGLQTSGKITQTIGLTESIEGRVVVVIEDIVDSGTTLHHFLDELKKLKPAEIKVATMFLKPDACRHEIKIDYLGMKIPNDFVVGYGLDFDGLGRNYRDLYKLKQE
jgi:hypoxanthine phosphoribosyltransferase